MRRVYLKTHLVGTGGTHCTGWYLLENGLWTVDYPPEMLVLKWEAPMGGNKGQMPGRIWAHLTKQPSTTCLVLLGSEQNLCGEA